MKMLSFFKNLATLYHLTWKYRSDLFVNTLSCFCFLTFTFFLFYGGYKAVGSGLFSAIITVIVLGSIIVFFSKKRHGILNIFFLLAFLLAIPVGLWLSFQGSFEMMRSYVDFQEMSSKVLASFIALTTTTLSIAFSCLLFKD